MDKLKWLFLGIGLAMIVTGALKGDWPAVVAGGVMVVIVAAMWRKWRRH